MNKFMVFLMRSQRKHFSKFQQHCTWSNVCNRIATRGSSADLTLAVLFPANKGEEAQKAKELSRVQKQMNMSLEEMLKDLPMVCIGVLALAADQWLRLVL